MIRAQYEHQLASWSDIFAHLPTLYDRASRPGVQVVELGVRTGVSTTAFLLAAEENDGYVWSVDTSPAAVPWESHPHWSFVQGDDLVLVDSLPDEVDIVFIDTSHHYGHTLAELTAYVPKVRPGGVILLHDTELEQPAGAPAGDPPFPVARALDAWCAETGHTWTNHPGCNGLGEVQL